MAKELTKILEHQVQESDASYFETHEQIERNMRYYTLEPLGNEVAGRSHYISPDVHDLVESKKALFKETFLSNRQTVKFKSTGLTPPGEAEGKTAYVQRILEKNEKSKLFSAFWHDAFLAKRGVVLAEWIEDTDTIEIPVQGANEQQLMQMAGQQGQVISVDTDALQQQQVPTMGPQGMVAAQTVFTGTMDVEVEDNYLRLTLCAPERYFRDPLADCVSNAMWATYQDQVPRGTLKREGYDHDTVDGLSNDYRWQRGDVDFARKAHDQSYTTGANQSRIDDQETITFFKTFTWINLGAMDLDIERGESQEEYPDEIRLYEIHWANGEILYWANGAPAIREVEEMPFFEWSELPISHSESGMCGADVVAHSQKTNSTLKRAIIDNANIRNNSRFEAVHDNLLNPRDLVDNTIGGVIFSDQIGSVAPLMAPDLSPMTFSAIQMLAQDTEARSGMSSLAKGMNSDALRYQNAGDMIERLTNAAKTRPMASARDWAQTFLIPLAQHIVRIGMQFDKSQDQVEAGGKLIPVIPSQWQDEELAMEVAVALTPDEGADHAQKLMVMHQTMLADPMLGQLYGLKERHSLMDDVFDAMGVADTQRYLMRPDSPEFQQQQQNQQQMAQQQQQQQMQMLQLQIKNMEETTAQRWAEINSRSIDRMEDNMREDDKLDWEKYTDTEELRLEAQQGRGVDVG